MEPSSKKIGPMPALMPRELRYYEQMQSEDALFEHMVKRPDELTTFIETACSDETWCSNHTQLVQRLLDWLTSQYLLGNFPRDFAERIATAIRQHYTILEHEVPDILTIELQDTQIAVNPLLFGTASRYFDELIASVCRETQIRALTLPDTTFGLFQPTLEFINTGTVKDLWKKNKEELFKICPF